LVQAELDAIEEGRRFVRGSASEAVLEPREQLAGREDRRVV
jgi:hypothetical protein